MTILLNDIKEDQVLMEDKRLTAEEIDTIGEIMNISMGAAATAVSTMLERQVVITTPRIEQEKANNIDCSELEPAIVVKIKYVDGLTGTNVIVFRRNDMRIILDLLMGNDLTDTDESFEFDDMSMSAACEVMNQMMGASATALSELLGKPINISTPSAVLIESNEDVRKIFDYDEDEDVTSISFKMTIKETLDTTFSSIMPLEFTKDIVRSLINREAEETPEPMVELQPTIKMSQQQVSQVAQSAQQQVSNSATQPPTQQQVPQVAPNAAPQQVQQSVPQNNNVPLPNAPQFAQQPLPQFTAPLPEQQFAQMPLSQQTGSIPYQQPFAPQMQEQYQYNYQNPQQPGSMYQTPYPQQIPYQPQYMHSPYGNEYFNQQHNPYQEPHANLRYAAPIVSVKQADFPEFANGKAAQPNPSNINMLMGVQLEVSVIVGRAKQKIKDIIDFGQGSVIELDKQTGAPAEIMVNGQLLAYGDVVVVGDNFGVRITEIVGTKELLDSLDTKK